MCLTLLEKNCCLKMSKFWDIFYTVGQLCVLAGILYMCFLFLMLGKALTQL